MLEDLEYIENTLRELSFYVHECINKQKRADFKRLFKVVYPNSPTQTVNSEELKLNSAKNRLTFTNKELTKMPQKYRNLFACKDYIVSYRTRANGTHEARLRCDGINVAVYSKDVSRLKQKFLDEFLRQIGELEKKKPVSQQKTAETVLFGDCALEWLKSKQRTVKESTYADYKRTLEFNILPKFKERTLASFTRSELEDFIFTYFDEKKFRTAEKVHLTLKCIFDLFSEEYNFLSPMRKVVLPYREVKKGSALTLLEERQLVDYCVQNNSRPVCNALLILLYFGLRRSELKTITISDEKLTCITSKQRLGRNEVPRTIPFTPVFRRVLPFVNFDVARGVNVHTLNTALKRILPNHHVHELRYTFITRCKECGVNPEIVMLWDGHEDDKDVRSSKVDRGYTDYTPEYQLKQAKLVDYTLPF